MLGDRDAPILLIAIGGTRTQIERMAADLLDEEEDPVDPIDVTTHVLATLPSFGPLVDLLAARSWAVVVAPEDEHFVCSDDPVVLLPTGTRSPNTPRGFGNADAHVFMPVGYRHGLYGTWPRRGCPPTWGVHHLDAREVSPVNTIVVLSARKFVASAEQRFSYWLNTGIQDRDAYIELVKNRPLAVAAEIERTRGE